jgi:hypothetical protein
MLFLIEGRYRVLFCGSGSPDTMKSCQENNHIDGMERRKYKEGAEGKGPDARNEGVKDMNIGEFNLKNGRLLGWIATHTIDLPAWGCVRSKAKNQARFTKSSRRTSATAGFRSGRFGKPHRTRPAKSSFRKHRRSIDAGTAPHRVVRHARRGLQCRMAQAQAAGRLRACYALEW